MEATIAAAQLKFDKDREAIIAEGVCDRRKVCVTIFYLCSRVCVLFITLLGVIAAVFIVYDLRGDSFYLYIGIFCVAALLASFILLLSLVYRYFRILATWRLYVTPSGIHYTQMAECSCHFIKEVFIPFTDIKDVSVISHPCQGWIIYVNMDPSKADKFVPSYRRSCRCNAYVSLLFTKNATEFVAAVKHLLGLQ